MKINEAVRALLDSGKRSRQEICTDLGVSPGLLSQWATGKELITEPHLSKLVDAAIPDSEGTKEAELLRLLLLLYEERVVRGAESERQRWTEASRHLAGRALRLGLDLTSTAAAPSAKSSGRTLSDFPFYPLAIVSGDKREDSASRITAADFGAVSASHAEFRWLCALKLRPEVELYGDKVFVLESASELRARFGKKHLLIVGSPGSNHLARRCLLVPPRPGWRPAAAIFRFNLPQHTLAKIEQFLEPLPGMRPQQLAGKRAEEGTERDMKNWLHYLFTGGIVDPTHTDHWLRGFDLPSSRDYGLVTLARNPFSDPAEPMFCVMVAGFHMLGTAHALRMLANPAETFARHPLGGVIEISINVGLPFAKRFDDSSADWDDKDGYRIDELRERLLKMQTDLAPTLHISREQIQECVTFLDEL